MKRFWQLSQYSIVSLVCMLYGFGMGYLVWGLK